MRRPGAIIFDRDGVLNHDFGYVCRPDQFQWMPDAKAAVKAVNDAGLFAFVATNQSGVARGYYGEADVEALHRWMNLELAALGARIDAFAFCPHHIDGVVEAFRRDCASRKPGPGMILRLLRGGKVDLDRAAMVGDKASDLEAAQAAGIKGVLFSGGSLLTALRPVIDHLASGAAA